MEDAARLLEWRNDSRTRASSHDTREVTLREHLTWLERALGGKEIEIFIAEEEGEPVGTVRSEMEGSSRKLSWTVAPEARGRGVGRMMVEAMAARIRGPIRAEVKKGNVASSRIAEHAGMILEREAEGVLHYSRS